MSIPSHNPRLQQQPASRLTQGLLVVVILVVGVDLALRFMRSPEGPVKREQVPVPIVREEPVVPPPKPAETAATPVIQEPVKSTWTSPAVPPSALPVVVAAPDRATNSPSPAAELVQQGRAWPRPMHGPLGLAPGEVSIQYFDPRAITWISVPVDEAEGVIPTAQGESSTGEGDAPAREGVSMVGKVGFPAGKGNAPTGKGASPAGEGDPQEPAPPAPDP